MLSVHRRVAEPVPWGRVAGQPLERVAVLATGPSLRRFDLKLLRGASVICVNGGIQPMPFAPDCWVTVDPSLTNRSIMRQRHRWAATQFYAAVPEKYGMPGQTRRFMQAPRELHVTYLRRLEPREFVGLSKDPQAIVTGNSSYGALNVATLRGARKVALLGVDGTGGYAWQAGRPRNLSRLRAIFNLAVGWLEREGVEVVVGSPNSTVDLWPRVTPEEAVEWLLQ